MRDGVTGKFELRRRHEATVSVFDSNFLIGDALQESLRVIRGRVLFARDHLDRLYQTAKALMFNLGLSKTDLLSHIHATIDANDGMDHDENVHVRLVVSRGLKTTPYQNPSVNVGLPLIVIIPEFKAAAAQQRGLRLVTSHVRRGAPDVKEEMWNHISKATDVSACIGANVVGADEALMLDPHGFVKTCNSTNFFIVRGGEVWSPTRSHQMHGITRQKTIDVCRANGVPVKELDFTLTEAYTADEAFCTGTFAGHIPVSSIDGRVIGDGDEGMGPVTKRVNELYKALREGDAGRSRAEITAAVAERRSKL
ncbi:hypothetical protein SLS57_011274 [Botryosphaeria dothidea]